MINNICPICKAVVSESEKLCPFCGTELNKNKSNNDTSFTKKNSSYYKQQTVNQESKPTSYVPYNPQNIPMPTSQRYDYNRQNTQQYQYGKSNSAQKNSTIGKRFITSIAITIAIVIALIFGIGICLTISESIADSQIRDIVLQNVDVEKISDIEKEYKQPTNKVAGQKNLYENEKYLIFKLTEDEYINEESYIRNFYVYVDKSVSKDAVYSADEYSCTIETDEYEIGIYNYYAYDERSELLYVRDSEICTKLNSLEIGSLIFEVYQIKSDYSLEYVYISKPVESGESFLYITVRQYGEEQNIKYKEIIRYVKTTKDIKSDE